MIWETQTFYSTDERKQALTAEAMTWLKTPVVPHGRSKGHGVDCVSLLGEIYRATGALEDYAKPQYEMASGAHLDSSVLEQYIASSRRFVRIWSRPELMKKMFVNLSESVWPGDCLCFQMGRVTHHVALSLGGKMLIHAIATAGVTYGALDDSTLARRVQAIYRPIPL